MKKLFGVRTKLSYYKVFHRKSIRRSNGKNADTYVQTSLLRFITIRIKEDINVWVLVWLCLFIHIKADDIYKDIAEDVETSFDTSNYELDRPRQKEKRKK